VKLSDAQWRIEDHYRINKTLPKTMSELYVGVPTIKAPESRAEFEYKIVDEDTYELCAEFKYPSLADDKMAASTMPFYDPTMKNPYSTWEHGAGKTCFERTIVKDAASLKILE
jgi:hypothetical protein